MTSRIFLAMALVAAPLPPPALAESGVSQRQISENAARATSEKLYSQILARACRNGWRYSRASIENGFRRHFGEFKAELAAQGYVIVEDDVPASATTPVAAVEPSSCFGRYWLKE
jgi:hypothetical protein